jgi:hypothetical protein
MSELFGVRTARRLSVSYDGDYVRAHDPGQRDPDLSGKKSRSVRIRGSIR